MSDEKQLSYEEARDQLVEVVRQLESGNVPLSTSMELWERGEKLGADAVIKAQYGDARVTALSWGSSAATGVAVKFVDPAAVPAPATTQPGQ